MTRIVTVRFPLTAAAVTIHVVDDRHLDAEEGEQGAAHARDGVEAAGEEVLELEVIDALPVREPASRSLPVASQAVPVLQTAAAAATGFLAGAAALALVHRAGARRLARELADLRDLRDSLQAARRRTDPFAMVPGRSYLVHVRVLSRPPASPAPPWPPSPPAP